MTLGHYGSLTQIIKQSKVTFSRKNGMTTMILHKDLELFIDNEDELGH